MGELPLRFTQKAGDWEASLIAQIGGAFKVGGGFWAFSFKSSSLNTREECFLMAGGLGLKGSIGGASATPTRYTKLHCAREFSLSDLHRSVGRIGSVGASLAVGYGAVTISAFPLSNPRYLFEESTVHGVSVGVGVQAFYFVGFFYCAKLGAPGNFSTAQSYKHSYAR